MSNKMDRVEVKSMNADFNIIRYANVWEDPRVLLKAVYNREPRGRYLSVASAGDNVFALLTLDPETVIAVDVSAVQLYLLELKMAAISQLNREDVLEFLGYRNCQNREEVFGKIKSKMSESAQLYFEKNVATWKQNGIIHSGKFERYFQYFSKYILPLIHSSRTIEELFQRKSADEQRAFFEKKWNSRRWRLIFRVFFSKWVMGRLGRDPEFLKQVTISVSEFILRRAEQQISSIEAQSNPFLRYNLTGSFGELLPFYLSEENFGVIKSRLNRIRLHCGYAEDAIEQYGKFDGMNLSNIFEYMPEQLFRETAIKLSNGLNPNGKMVYWNLMVRRRCSEVSECKQIRECQTEMQELRSNDWGYFYEGVVVDQFVEIQEIKLDALKTKFECMGGLSSVVAYHNSQIEKGRTLILGNYYCDEKHANSGLHLLKYCVDWAKEQGFESVVGPMNGSTWDTYRFKVKGHRNFLGDLEQNDFYIKQWEWAGFQPTEKYVSSMAVAVDSDVNVDRYRKRQKQLEMYGIVFRKLDMNRWEQELKQIYHLSLRAFRHNAFYTHIDWDTFLQQYQSRKGLLDANWILMAEDTIKQELVGFVFSYLDLLNEAALIVKTVARKSDYKFSGLGLVMTNILHEQAQQQGVRNFIHAFMHHDAISNSCSESMKTQVISEYYLYRKNICT